MSKDEVKKDNGFFKREIQKLKEEYVDSINHPMVDVKMNKVFNKLKLLSAIADFEIKNSELL